MKSKKTKATEDQILLPRANPDFFGYENILADMCAAFKSGNMPCGWLICGPAGIGKATLAYRFARFILHNGENKNDGFFASEAPNVDLSIPQNSKNFIKVSNGTHPDLLVLGKDGIESKSTTGEILVEDARKIGNFLHLTSSESPYRIIIIDSIDNMNANAANSILKLLEEPPSKSMFLLISHSPGRLLPTIRSRCRQVKMHKPDSANALKILQNIAPDLSTDIAESLLQLADGSPGAAYDLHIHNGFALYEEIIALMAQLPRPDIMALQKLGDNISGKNNEDSWRIFGVLINKIITDITKQTATGQQNSKNRKLSVAMDAQRLVEIWQEVNHLLIDADNLHLERKAIIVRIFNLLAGKT